ncbi:MAG TPA: potassium-transporting ATPase subunit KdpC [Burkholderiaceae bacterium]|nr:potassium-transporting ATPase subunit KdpC [Burkholderiaceae bacterium]
MTAALMLMLLTLVTGVAYPGLITAVSQLAMREQAHGSLIVRDGTAAGSMLIGQPFSDPKYFWSRPSATSPQPYNGMSSGGSNLGPTNPALVDAVKERIAALKAADPDNPLPIPQDLVTASASGLDPHISEAAAAYQARRVARQRNLDEATVRTLVAAHTEPRQLGVLGEPRVNVLALNLALDASR